jgi:hypothetical protein
VKLGVRMLQKRPDFRHEPVRYLQRIRAATHMYGPHFTAGPAAAAVAEDELALEIAWDNP